MNQAFTNLVQHMESIFNEPDTSSAHEKAVLLSKFNEPNAMTDGIKVNYARRLLMGSLHDSISYKIETKEGTLFTDGKIFLMTHDAESLVSFHVYANGLPVHVGSKWTPSTPLMWWYKDQPKPDLTKFM